jgi:hypothetical protein
MLWIRTAGGRGKDVERQEGTLLCDCYVSELAAGETGSAASLLTAG